MKAHPKKSEENKRQSSANNFFTNHNSDIAVSTFQFSDNREGSIAQKVMKEHANKNPIMQLRRKDVVQFGGVFGKPAKPPKINRYRSKKEPKQYPKHKYEKWYNYRNVRISELTMSEGGDKSSAELRERLEAVGYDKHYAILVVRESNGELRVVDGHHRVTEMADIGEEKIPAYVISRKNFDAQEKKYGSFYSGSW